MPTAIEVKEFRQTVLRYYKKHGRHDLPWRLTTDPYAILVSELMLQQTQVVRVIPKYAAFLAAFPTMSVLAAAPLSAVLTLWQGLGYNRRAKYLHELARVVTASGGSIPDTRAALEKLPGIGTYTAGAILAFAYNQKVTLIETNVRTVFLYHFFPNTPSVPDSDIMPIITAALPRKNSRNWYYALMDYGVFIKQTKGNPNRNSRHYTKQSPFNGSNRQIRGAIIRLLSVSSKTNRAIKTALVFPASAVDVQLERLVTEGLVRKSGQSYSLPE